MMESLQGTPVSAKQIKQWTGRDPQLARVRQMIRDGWTEHGIVVTAFGYSKYVSGLLN